MSKYEELRELKLDHTDISNEEIRKKDNDLIDRLNLLLYEAIEKAEKYDEIKKTFEKSTYYDIERHLNKIKCDEDKCDSCNLCLGDFCLKNMYMCRKELKTQNKVLKDGVKALNRQVKTYNESKNPHSITFSCRLGGIDADDFKAMLEVVENE